MFNIIINVLENDQNTTNIKCVHVLMLDCGYSFWNVGFHVQ